MNKVKPFLRWAGGKRWLLKEVDKFLPKDGFNQYHEPFIGGGALFFYLNNKISYISDINEELINTYKAIQKDVGLVIRYLKEMKKNKDFYYEIRNHSYRSKAKNAAKFIYLNHMSFNGIYRVNKKGEYNVPYGNRDNYNFDYVNLEKVSNYLSDVNIECTNFYDSLKNIKKNDLVFLDPPYTVTHNSNGFIQYNQKIFSVEEQYKLSEMIKEIKRIGAYYILTNAAHPKVYEIFENGDTFIELKRSSIVGGKNSKRGKYAELIMTNGVIK